MRLFAAIDLTDEARAAIAKEQDRLCLKLAGSSPTWVGPEQMHLTLVFIGEVSDLRAAAIGDAMREDVPQQPFRLTFGGLGIFPPHGAPRVLWIGTVEGAAAAAALQERVAGRLEAHGVAREARPFRPHLTLARWRHARPSDRGLLSAEPRGSVSTLDVTEVTLYQSRLSASEAVHTALARARLAGSGP